MRGPLTALVAAGSAVLLASCGLVGPPSSDDASTRVAKVAVLVPEGTASGAGVHAAVAAAIENTVGELDGWSVEVETVDDSPDDETDLVTVAEELSDDDVVAVVGGLSTETVRTVQPVFDESSLLFISPADTLPEHTRGADANDPIRPYETYFRTAISSDDPLYALARHAVNVLDVDTVAVIDAGNASDDEAGVFADAIRAAGGEVVRVDERDDAEGGNGSDDAADGNDDGATPDSGDDAATGGAVDPVTVDDVAPMLERAQGTEAGAVFVSGSPDVAAEMADQLASAGMDLELLGSQAVTSETFLAEAGSSAEGAWGVVPGELAPTDGAAPDELQERMAGSDTPPGQYGAAAYDAGTAVGTVLERCLPPAASATSAREGCVGEMAALTFRGVTGEVEFDRFGDRVGARPVVRTVRDGRWTAVDQAGQ